MHVRLARSSDRKEIECCAFASYKKYVERIGKKPAPMIADFSSQIDEKNVYILTSSDALLQGFIVFYQRNNHMFIENVAVSPKHQGKGIGKLLMNFCEDEAKRLNLQAIELYTNEKMYENLMLYTHLGFAEIDRREEHGFNRVFFRKLIPNKRHENV